MKTKTDLRRINNFDFTVRFVNTCNSFGVKTIHSAKKLFTQENLRKGTSNGSFQVTQRLIQELNDFLNTQK